MIAGVDEAGRGALAGPVVAASVILTKPLSGLNDSKQLSKKKRLALFLEITRECIWSWATASPSEIERLNIRGATLLAMRRSVLGLSCTPDQVLIDGRDSIELPMKCQAIIGGDASVSEIMAASIIAKCMRDRLMECYHHSHPEYGFLNHKGYGTKLHLDAMRLHGLIMDKHRLTYKPCRDLLAVKQT
ncbi:ribonuclease HII [Candidatus Comchoanobacter bicostacola]|uniref:Ribonuclease HII n=1 Tax=Candidatus Comchoanobacter bicostacola TaxID=2919598 RepID=A0ABY5DKI0_9GAMM|nr:ribonuclease HII [Candidatus Comchoanobacter bicostacola]UTC24665.1 ribonuclease HII [Candidatus Comchoanobacter bicostacola]